MRSLWRWGEGEWLTISKTADGENLILKVSTQKNSPLRPQTLWCRHWWPQNPSLLCCHNEGEDEHYWAKWCGIYICEKEEYGLQKQQLEVQITEFLILTSLLFEKNTKTNQNKRINMWNILGIYCKQDTWQLQAAQWWSICHQASHSWTSNVVKINFCDSLYSPKADGTRMLHLFTFLFGEKEGLKEPTFCCCQ